MNKLVVMLLLILLLFVLFNRPVSGQDKVDLAWIEKHGVPSICRIRAFDGQGLGIGTGCMMGNGQILTCKHMVRGCEAKDVVCEFKWEQIKVKEISRNKYVDMAVLVLERYPQTYIPNQTLSNWMPPGSIVYCAGFDRSDPEALRVFPAQVSSKELDYGDVADVIPVQGYTKAMSGNSGGPVWNEYGALVSTIATTSIRENSSQMPNGQHLLHFMSRIGAATLTKEVQYQQDL